MKKRKLLSLILAMVLACALLPTAGAAEYTVTEVVPLGKYDYVENFSEGLAVVCIGDYSTGKYGYIDATGKEVIPCKYDRASGFHSGLAAVCVGRYPNKENWGFIDKTGREVIAPQYDRAYRFSGDYAIVEKRVGDSYDWISGVIDRTGREVLSLGDYHSLGVVPDSEQSANITNVSDGMIVYAEHGKCGYLGMDGTKIPAIYDWADGFHDGLAEVALGNVCAYINTKGEQVTPFQYVFDYWGNPFIDGIAMVERVDGSYTILDKTGKELVPSGKYSWITTPNTMSANGEYGWQNGNKPSEGLYAARNMEGKAGFIDVNGNEVIPFIFDSAENFSEGLAAVKMNEKWGYIDLTGRVVIPCKYDWALGEGDFSDGRAVVEIDGKYGYLDATGREVIAAKWDYAHPFSGGFAVVGEYRSRLNSLIDVNGKEVISGCQSIAYDPDNGVAIVKKDGQWGVMAIQAVNTAYASTQSVLVDGKAVEFQAYALKDANGNDTNYIKLRDVASILNGSAVQFNVGWDGAVNIETGKAYVSNGSEMKTPFSGNRDYEIATAETRINGSPAALDAIVLKDDNGGAYTYYKLRDLGNALGFKVDWSAEKGIYIETK